jgi:hypothetical protein
LARSLLSTPQVGRRPSRPDLGRWWPSRLVATAAEDRLNTSPTN